MGFYGGEGFVAEIVFYAAGVFRRGLFIHTEIDKKLS